MTVYLILIIYIIFISILYCILKTKYKNETKLMKKIYLFSTFIAMLIVMGCRGKNVGTDTYSYTIYFKQICDYHFLDAMEFFPVGWVILNKFIGLLFNVNSFFYIFCISFLFLFLIAKFIYDNSENIVVSTILFILFYHYFGAFNGMRQYLAIAISLNSFKFLLRKKNIYFLIVNFIAVLIHPTSIIFLVLLTTKYIKQDFTSFFKIVLLSCFAILFINHLAQLFVDFFPHYQLYIDGGNIGTYGFGQGQNRSFIITIIYIFFEVLMLYRLAKNNSKCDGKLYFYIFVNLVGIIFSFLSLQNILFTRIAWYFVIFAIIYIPYCFKFFNNKDNFYLNVIFIFIMFIPCFIQLSENINGVCPFLWFDF